MKVLIVEDNPTDRKLLKINLERHGCDIIEAQDGEEALEMARIHKPAVIISDALMPRMDGFQFLRALKEDETLKSIPFIFYSAVYTGYKEQELALSLGAEAFIVKPKSPEELWDELCAIVEACKIKEGKIKAKKEPIKGDEEFLRKYSQIVAAKLDEKVRELEEEITKRRQIEEALRKSEAEFKRLSLDFQTLLDTIPDNLTQQTSDLKILWANRGAADSLGMEVQDLIGQYCYKLWHNRSTPCEVCPVQKSFRTGKPERGEVITPDGRIWDLISAPIINENGKVNSVIEVGRDITAQKHTEENLKQRVKELEEFYEMAVGREIRMKELKEEIKRLEAELSRYKKDESSR
jgi:PAS domain S-box-containing protein